VLVTGGNAGLGFDVCKTLANLNANVLLVARNEERGKKAVADINKENVQLLLCDVSIQKQVHDLIAQVPSLDVLVLNAGILPADERVEVEGVERVLGKQKEGVVLVVLFFFFI
jgi:NAD(P)-dependent dehydrogenase (short-subunit alcohol dehydrogenase family)